MPYEWSPAPPHHKPEWQLSLWPYRSLLRRDFVLFMGATLALVALPLLTVIGSPVLWGLLPFFLLAIWGLWTALNVSYRRGEVLEELIVNGQTAHLTRHNPRGPLLEWKVNRQWVSVHLHPTGGPVEDYITMKGEGREVEIGAFLSPAERRALFGELRAAFAKR